MADSYEGKIIDYRESHTRIGKGAVYQDSFYKYSFRKHMWLWEQKQLDIIFDEKLTDKASILDFACGTGRILKYLSTKSNHVTGVDLSDVMLEVCKTRVSNVELINADISRDNVFEGNRTFDVITAFRFFLNAQNDLRVEVLNALHPLLKDDGIFIFNNHGNKLHLGYPIAKFVSSVKNLFLSKEKKIYNLNALSERKTKQLLNDSGFEVIKTYHRAVLPIANEKTSFDVTKISSIEDWFSSIPFLRIFAKNIMYVCQKKK